MDFVNKDALQLMFFYSKLTVMDELVTTLHSELTFDDFLEVLVRVQYVSGHASLQSLLDDFLERVDHALQAKPTGLGSTTHAPLGGKNGSTVSRKKSMLLMEQSLRQLESESPSAGLAIDEDEEDAPEVNFIPKNQRRSSVYRNITKPIKH